MEPDVVPVVLCIDVEPAGRDLASSPGPWPETVAVHHWLAGLRERIESATGRPARFGWFLRMDPQIESVFGGPARAAEVHRDLLADARAHGDSVGLHVHAWRRQSDGDLWLDDLADGEWVHQCLDAAFATYEEAFGQPCRTTRMGCRFLTDEVAAELGRRGVEVDLTPEAGRRAVAAGDQPYVTAALPDYRRSPRGPYRWTRDGPVHLPLTATRRRLGANPRHQLSRIRQYGIREPLDLPLTLRHEVDPPDTFADRVQRSVRGQRRPYLAFASTRAGPTRR